LKAVERLQAVAVGVSTSLKRGVNEKSSR